MLMKKATWAVLAACALSIATTSAVFAGDPRSTNEFKNSPPSSTTEKPATTSCKTEIGEFESKHRINLDWGFGYEEAMIGEWSGHWWTPENNAGGEFRLHIDHVTKHGVKTIVHSYYLMRHGHSNGCGRDWFPRSPSLDSPQPYNETWLHGGATFDHTHWNHPFELHRVEREDGKVEYYMIADTKFGQLHDDGLGKLLSPSRP